MSAIHSRQTLIAAALVCLIGIFYLATIRAGHVWGDDHAAYISHAKNIAEGKEYGNTGYIRAPSSINPRMYPPVFPLLLAPLYHWYGLNLTPMKAAGIAFFCLALFCFYLLVRDSRDDAPAMLAVAVIGICPYFWDFKDTVLSEFPFLAFAYAALLTAEMGIRTKRSVQSQILRGILVGLLCGTAYGTRNVGVILLPAVILADYVAVRRVSALAAAAIAVFAIMVVAQNLLFGIEIESDYTSSYLQVLSPRTLASAPLYYLRYLSVLWENGYSATLQWLLFGITVIMALYGGWVRTRTKWSVTELFVLLYFAFISLFPWGGRRYLMPIMPLFAFYALLGLQAAGTRMSDARRLALQGTTGLAIALSFFGKYSTFDWKEIPNGTQRKEVADLIDFVHREVGKDEAIVFRKARFLALYGQRKAVDIYKQENLNEVVAFYRAQNVSHVVTSTLFVDEEERCLENLIAQRQDLFQRVHENGPFTVFRLNPEPPSRTAFSQYRWSNKS
jgi:4-amino-4-deoxy-L-arabinose transferase-like glycosyltransferase